MKECTAWVWWHRLSVVGKQRVPVSERTIGNLTKGRLIIAPAISHPDDSVAFIVGLEKDYPSTVSTIAKTAGKLAPKGESGIRCVLCEL
jgi:cytoplasmic tRNA 2-thiolation protein 2